MKLDCFVVTAVADRNVCFHIRHQVFVLEQHVPADRELDGLDDQAQHYAARLNDKIIATCRVRLMHIKKGKKPPIAKIERMTVLSEYRGLGVGKILIEYILRHLKEFHQVNQFKLSAQQSAIPFYEKLGFKADGAEYLDANIPHLDMSLENS